VIQLAGIYLRYPSPHGPVDAFNGVDLHVPAGQVFGVIGRSGAGKSSLIRTINLLTRPTQGRVQVDGRDLTALSAEDLRTARHGIGMIFQHFNLLFSRTVFENVALPLQLVHERPAARRREQRSLRAAA
jgi:D-methionine transport system ATP-binding protein